VCAVQAGRGRLSAPAISARPVQSLALDAGLIDIRELVRASATAAGLGPSRVGEVVLAAHEVAMNALTHGRGDGVVELWRDGGELVCEVRDRGPGMTDPSAGSAPPDPDELRGRGLWIARHLCELVEIETGEAGTRVRLRVRLAA
jgi:anti-sigma regulatory factor (Ser/Thr protein kinase)